MLRIVRKFESSQVPKNRDSSHYNPDWRKSRDRNLLTHWSVITDISTNFITTFLFMQNIIGIDWWILWDGRTQTISLCMFTYVWHYGRKSKSRGICCLGNNHMKLAVGPLALQPRQVHLINSRWPIFRIHQEKFPLRNTTLHVRLACFELYMFMLTIICNQLVLFVISYLLNRN